MPRQPRLSAILGAERAGVAPGATKPRQRPLRVPEKHFQRQVTDLALLNKWYVYHNPDSRRSAAGMTDLVLLRPPRALFVELKREDGRLRPEQKAVIFMLRMCGIDARLWRPSDWDEIKSTLTAPREEPPA